MQLPYPSDVRVRTAPVPTEIEGATARGVLWQAATGRFLLEVPGVARYLVEDGRRMTIEPAPAATDADVGRFAGMTPLAALAWQRGLLALHGAAVAGPNGAVLLAGDSGAGKSTLAAALVLRGWRMLADDLAIVELDDRWGPLVHPGATEVVLWADTVERLHTMAASGPIARAGPDPHGRCVIRLDHGSAGEAVPLRTVHWLSARPVETVECADMSGAERFRAIGYLSYNSRVAAALLDRERFLSSAAFFARSVPMGVLRRPRGRWSIDELADAVESASGA